MRSRRVLGLVLTVAALAAPGVAAAQTVSFGADLNRPANSTLTCSDNPSPPFLGILQVPPPFNASCSWFNNGSANTINNPAASEGFLPPAGNGRVVRALVKVGPVTAPMQIVIAQAYRGAVNGCCTAVRVSQTFVPAANAVTAVPLDLATGTNVVGDPQVDPTAVFDVVALSVLASNVPIPANDTGVHDVNDPNSNLTYACYPALTQPDQQCVPMQNGIASSGFVVLARFDWVPSATAPGPTPPGPAQPGAVVAAPALAIINQTVPVRGGVARVRLVCGATAPCVGQVLLQSRAAAGGAAAAGRVSAAAKRRTYGQSKLNIPAGKRKSVGLRLNGAGRRLLRGRSSARVWLNARIDGKPVSLGRIKLRRP